MKKLILILIAITSFTFGQGVYQLEGTRTVINNIETQSIPYASFNGVDNKRSQTQTTFGSGDVWSYAFYINATDNDGSFMFINETGTAGISLIKSGVDGYTFRNQSFEYPNETLILQNIWGLNTFVVYVANGNSTITVYQNGSNKGTLTLPSGTSAVFNGFSPNLTYPFKGKLYEDELFNFALTQAEVTALYNSGRPDLYKLPYKWKWATQTMVSTYDSSGTDDLAITLTAGKEYYWLKGSADSLMIGTTKYSSSSRFTYSSGTVRAKGDLTGSTLKLAGVIASYKFNEGNGYLVKDESTNRLDGTVAGTVYQNGTPTFWQNSPESYTIRFGFMDQNVSQTGATTTLFKLPPNVEVERAIVEVDTAFVGADTVSIGFGTGADTSWVASFSGITTTGTKVITQINKFYSDKSEKQMYIKKSDVSTAGYLRVIIYLKNWASN